MRDKLIRIGFVYVALVAGGTLLPSLSRQPSKGRLAPSAVRAAVPVMRAVADTITPPRCYLIHGMWYCYS